jgi:hypothetical protein
VNQYIYFEDTENKVIVFLYSVCIKEKMASLTKFERGAVYLDIFYKMDFIRANLLKKHDHHSISDYIEGIKDSNTDTIQTNVLTLTRHFLIINPISVKSSFYKHKDNIILRIEVTNVPFSKNLDYQ